MSKRNRLIVTAVLVLGSLITAAWAVNNSNGSPDDPCPTVAVELGA